MSAGLASFPKSRWRALGGVLALSGASTGLALGCGARGYVVEEALIDDGSGGGGGRSGGTGSGATGAGASSPGQMLNFEITQLPACVLGMPWSATSSQDCNFRFNGRCYEDTTSVCACACPRDSNSRCTLSGFLSDPDNPLMVSCQPRR